ncbi:hypothetical protein PILCRDRAFT_771706 [Piloderma croceum F 1598]|uniref:SigF-like NTF2-like domain-containing protein n=1 Tax=Piloderma croceum (strain F 1598) TaxID=765440 RepID=A0A0C3G7V5_PILCF|nr:hypothetical protein PILCRDRAFT_771706 [Piloderma croceum F 1598]
MQNPTLEIPSIITALTSAPSSHLPLTFQKYFLPDAGFRHPLCRVDRGEGSREKVAGVYEWYRVMSPWNGTNILSVGNELMIWRVVYDEEKDILYVEVEQHFHVIFSPFKPAPSKLTIRLTLQEQAGLHYIATQEDFYHPEDLTSLILPPLTPMVRLCLNGAGVVSNINARVAGFVLGMLGMGVGAGVGVGIEDVSVAAGDVGNAVGKVEDVGKGAGDVGKVADGVKLTNEAKVGDGEKVAGGKATEGGVAHGHGVKGDGSARDRDRDRDRDAKDKDDRIDMKKLKKREGEVRRRALG